MSDELKMSLDLAHELEITMRKAGWETADVARVAKSEGLCQSILAAVRGHADIKPAEHLVDCDADPFIPEGWSVEEHRKDGLIRLDTAKIALYLSKIQKGGWVVTGRDLRNELEGKPVLNANALDYLLDHPHLIPEGWKGKAVFFWGTIYRDRDGDLSVRCLYWNGGRWYWHYYWLASDWLSDHPAAVAVS